MIKDLFVRLALAVLQGVVVCGVGLEIVARLEMGKISLHIT